jgi:hypothetical protein
LGDITGSRFRDPTRNIYKSSIYDYDSTNNNEHFMAKRAEQWEERPAPKYRLKVAKGLTGWNDNMGAEIGIRIEGWSEN